MWEKGTIKSYVLVHRFLVKQLKGILLTDQDYRYFKRIIYNIYFQKLSILTDSVCVWLEQCKLKITT